MNEISKILEYSYKNVGMFQIYSEIFEFSKFFKELNCKNILEIGSYYGGTFFVLCKLSNNEGKKISIDYPFYEGQEFQMQQRKTHENMRTFANNVHIIKSDSHLESTVNDLENILNGEELDFIFIDGDHTYEGVKKDFEMYIPFLKDGGYVGFHDINDTAVQRDSNCYVGKLWNELESDVKIEFNTHSIAMGIGIIKIHKYKKRLNMSLSFDRPNKINIYNNDFSDLDTFVSIRDRDTKIPIYHDHLVFSQKNNGFFIIPLQNYNFSEDPNFSGFLIEFYDKDKNFIDSKDLQIKERTSPIPYVTRKYGPFDCLFMDFKQLFYDKIYDDLEIDNVSSAIDIGANVGLFSNYMTWKQSVRTIHAIEPTSKAFKELKKQFFYYHGVHCHQLGIHYIDGKSKINVNDRMSIFSTFLTENQPSETVEEVDVKTLPNFMNSVNLPTVDLVKIDIEGLEYEIFNSMTNSDILRASKWIVEYHLNDDGKAEMLQTRLSKLGYKIKNVPDKVPDFLNNGIAVQGFFFAKK